MESNFHIRYIDDIHPNNAKRKSSINMKAFHCPQNWTPKKLHHTKQKTNYNQGLLYYELLNGHLLRGLRSNWAVLSKALKKIIGEAKRETLSIDLREMLSIKLETNKIDSHTLSLRIHELNNRSTQWRASISTCVVHRRSKQAHIWSHYHSQSERGWGFNLHSRRLVKD
jgi:hypothetical protein